MAAKAGITVAPDVLSLRVLIANVCLIGEPKSHRWVLVDTGVAGAAAQIVNAAAERFGAGAGPLCIILTHGHFDHVGSVAELCDRWGVFAYAHALELPFLTGQTDYPAGNPDAGGGLITAVSPFFPHRAINLGHRIRPLPSDGTVPGLAEWTWLHTPGHTPGHISLWRKADRILISGDAALTVQQESALAVLLQTKEIHGPPGYFTMDRAAAALSAGELAALRPAAMVPGHGTPMQSEQLSAELQKLAADMAATTTAIT